MHPAICSEETISLENYERQTTFLLWALKEIIKEVNDSTRVTKIANDAIANYRKA